MSFYLRSCRNWLQSGASSFNERLFVKELPSDLFSHSTHFLKVKKKKKQDFFNPKLYIFITVVVFKYSFIPFQHIFLKYKTKISI